MCERSRETSEEPHSSRAGWDVVRGTGMRLMQSEGLKNGDLPRTCPEF